MKKTLLLLLVIFAFNNDSNLNVKAYGPLLENTINFEVETDDGYVMEADVLRVGVGHYIVDIPFYLNSDSDSELSRTQLVAMKRIHLQRRYATSTLVDVDVEVSGTILFNGINGNLLLTSTNVVNQRTFLNAPLIRNFPATRLQHHWLVAATIPLNEDVRIRTSNVRIHTLSNGWLSGVNINTINRP